MEGRWNRERFRGMRVFVVGGGPSLRGLDIDTPLMDEFVIGCNDAYKMPCVDLCCFGDNAWGRMHQERLLEWGREVWTNNSHFQFTDEFKWLRKTPHLSTNGDAAAWFGNTGYLGLQLALLGNPNEVVLLGYDMQMIGGMANWHDDNRGQPRPCDYVTMLKHIDEIVEEVKEKYPHVKVLNADPISRLRGFDMVDPQNYGIEIPDGHVYKTGVEE